jgi:hypothetical protein
MLPSKYQNKPFLQYYYALYDMSHDLQQCVFKERRNLVTGKKMDMTDCEEIVCRAITPPKTTPNKRLLIVMWKQCYAIDNVLIISKGMLY